MKKFYVYELWNPIKNEPFYVGKGLDNRCETHLYEATKAKKGERRNWHKINTIKKIQQAGFEVEIKKVYWSDIEQEALDEEKRLISFYGRRDQKLGPLTNLTDGGDGVSGKIFTNEERKRCSERMSGKGNPMWGKKGTNNPNYGNHIHSEKEKQIRSERFSGKGNPMYGRNGSLNTMWGMKGDKHPSYGKPAWNTNKEMGKTNNAQRKLSEQQVIEIRNSVDSCAKLGIKYNMSADCINKVKRKLTYKWVE